MDKLIQTAKENDKKYLLKHLNDGLDIELLVDVIYCLNHLLYYVI